MAVRERRKNGIKKETRRAHIKREREKNEYEIEKKTRTI
jgi:hypothetical protein